MITYRWRSSLPPGDKPSLFQVTHAVLQRSSRPQWTRMCFRQDPFHRDRQEMSDTLRRESGG